MGFRTFNRCGISDGSFKRLILKQIAFPFPPMICRLSIYDQFGEAFRRVFKVKSFPIQWRVVPSTPLNLYTSVAPRAKSSICIEETLKLDGAVCRC